MSQMPEAPLSRAACPAMDACLGVAHPVLDHGFIRVVDYMGNDEAVAQAARVSYGSGTKHTSTTRGLIRYLMRHHHSSPFEMCEIKVHVKLPVFVARQWIRHRTANVNEYSARYSILDREFYIPDPGNIAKQSTTNRQGSGELLSVDDADLYRKTLQHRSEQAFDLYDSLLDEQDGPGMARELARIHLPANVYTQWYWKTDLHNLLHFLRLRADGHAQSEIRAYANTLAGLVRQWVPLSFEAFEDYRLHARTLSKPDMEALRVIVTHALHYPSSPFPALPPMGKTEYQDLVAFCATIGITIPKT